MSPTNSIPTDQLTRELANLLTVNKEEILAFFKQDLSTLEGARIIGNLKMLTMFMDSVEVAEFKKAILSGLAETNRQITGLVDYLKASPYDDLKAQVPFKGGHDHFDFEAGQEVERFRRPGTAYEGHRFGQELQKVWAVLSADIQAKLKDDDLLKRRLESIVVTYLKDIRDALETRQRLAASSKVGGMGFSYELVDKIFAVLEEKVRSRSPEKIDYIPKIQPLKEPFPKVASAAISQPGLPEVVVKGVRLKPIKLDTERIQPISKPKVPQPPQIVPVVATREAASAEERRELSRSQPPRARPAPATKKQAKIVDIKYPAGEVYGPTDEFRSLGLEDLRRESDQRAFIQRILDKIKRLSEEDYNNRSKSIQAWKKSHLYQEYVAIGQKSLLENKSVEECLAEAPPNSLTAEEFEMIGELNQKLRF